MKVSSFVTLLPAFLSAANGNPLLKDRAACNADDCARAATGTAGGLLNSRISACSSFFSYTIIRPTSTSYVTINTTVPAFTSTITTNPVFAVKTLTSEVVQLVRTTPAPPKPLRRDVPASIPVSSSPAPKDTTVTPTALPMFASAQCDGSTDRYSSACSCFGIPHTLFYPEPNTTTVTVTRTVGPEYVAASTTVYTSTAVATHVTPLFGVACGSIFEITNYCECVYKVVCGNDATGGHVLQTFDGPLDEYNCASRCEPNKGCTAANWNTKTGKCTLLTDSPLSNPALVPAADDDAVLLAPQNCRNKAAECR